MSETVGRLGLGIPNSFVSVSEGREKQREEKSNENSRKEQKVTK